MNESIEAVVVLAKCGEVHKTYGIRAEKLQANHWRFTWAFPIKESSAKREGYDKSRIGGVIDFADDYPGCPYCGQKHYTVCSCGHISCTLLKKVARGAGTKTVIDHNGISTSHHIALVQFKDHPEI